MDNENVFMAGAMTQPEKPFDEDSLEDSSSNEIPPWSQADFQGESDQSYAPGPLANASPFAQVEVTLGTLGNGGVEARFQHALNDMVHNIMDMNTDAKATRKIVVEVIFKPSPTRANVEVTSSVTTKLASWKALDSSVAIGVAKDGTDRSSAIERQVADV